jgi:hypothetical protein
VGPQQFQAGCPRYKALVRASIYLDKATLAGGLLWGRNHRKQECNLLMPRTVCAAPADTEIGPFTP